MALAALLLALLATANRLSMAGLILLSAASAAAMAFDSPTRQSWVPTLVDRQYVGNAVGLNSVAFNAPAVIGPALAGLLIVWIGVSGAFYFNAGATLAVVVAVMMMHPAPPSVTRREPTLQAIRYGITFIARHPALRWIVLAQLVTALIGSPVQSARSGVGGERLACRRTRSRLVGFGDRRGRIRRCARHRVFRATRAAVTTLAAVRFGNVAGCVGARFRSNARGRPTGSLRDRCRNARVTRRDEYADSNALAGRRTRTRPFDLYDDCHWGRSARRAWSTAPSHHSSVCGRRSHLPAPSARCSSSRSGCSGPRYEPSKKKRVANFRDSLKFRPGRRNYEGRS